MKTYQHPEMGKFKRDEYGYFAQLTKIGGKRARLILDCDTSGADGWEKHLEKSARVAAHIYDGLDQLVDDAKDIASTKLLDLTNETREEEELKPITSAALKKKLSLMDIAVGPKEIFVNLSCSAFEDEHGMFVVSFGPKGGFKGVVAE